MPHCVKSGLQTYDEWDLVGDRTGPTNGVPSEKVWEPVLYECMVSSV